MVALRRRFNPAPGLVELGSNENSHGPSPHAVAAVREALGELHRYPDPAGSELKLALASYHGLASSQILLGNGSHELLMMLAQVFAGPGLEVVASQFGFAVYALATQAAGATLKQAPAFSKFETMARGHDLRALAAQVGPMTRLVYLANPNNPTGTWFTAAALAAFLEKLPSQVIVVVDEAYLEFVNDPALPSALLLLERFPNLVVARTFSKGYALAGLRVGFIVAHPALIAVMERVRESFNVNVLALTAAQAALYDQDHLDGVRDSNAGARAALASALRARGLAVADSQTNFLLVDFGQEATSIEAALLAEGVVLRPMGGYGLPSCLRITVGTADENGRLLSALDTVLA